MLIDELIKLGKFGDALILIKDLELEGSYTVDSRLFYNSVNFSAAHEYCRNIRTALEGKIASGKADFADVELWRKSLLFDAPHDFDSFCRYVECKVPPSKQFYSPRRKYLKQVTQGYQDIFDGKIKLLLVELVKRAGKSQLGILATCFISGKYPDRATLMEGTGEDLVDSFYKGCLEYLGADTEYSYYDVFSSGVVDTKADSRVINLGTKTRFPTIMCRSIDAKQVGLSEATNMLYLDDCVNGYLEAQNKARLAEKWKVISGDVIGRALEGTPIVACGTRYSVYDPMSRLENEAINNNWPYRVIKIPALDDNDKSNYEFYNPRIDRMQFTSSFFIEQRSLLSKPQFMAEFQQEPFETKGLMFPEEKLNRYFKLPVDKDPDGIMCVCDTAEGSGDSVMMPIAYLYGTDVYIEDCVFSDALPEFTKPMCAKKIIEHKVQDATFESNAAGKYFCVDVEKLVANMGGMCAFKSKFTTGNKETRIVMASDTIIKNFWFKDKSLYTPQSDYGRMMKELTSYTRGMRGAKAQHDDAPDGLSLLENAIRKMQTSEMKVLERFF